MVHGYRSRQANCHPARRGRGSGSYGGADILMDADFRVIEAVNADEALTLLEARPDVRAIVTDVEMPGSLNGFTFARVVHKAWPQIGIVIMSGRQGPGDEDLPRDLCPGSRSSSRTSRPSIAPGSGW